MQFIFDRLKERSTWAGLVGLLTAAGVGLTPEKADAIISAGVAVVSLIFVFTKDIKTPDKPNDSSIG